MANHRCTMRITLDVTVNVDKGTVEIVELKDSKNIRNEWDSIVTVIPRNMDFAREEGYKQGLKDGRKKK